MVFVGIIYDTADIWFEVFPRDVITYFRILALRPPHVFAINLCSASLVHHCIRSRASYV
jgi:hypothetical protein